ncbi:hypothetical protein E0L31_026795, partial [Serratia marcescens]|nr:hypothetical protein [Serratia marcescens]
MNTYEMEGFLRGQCVPRDLLVNESNAAYLVRKLSEIASVKAERDALAVENAVLKKFGDKLNEMHNDLNGEGTGIQGRAEVVCQQAAIEAAMDEFDAITTTATDAALAAIQAQGVEKLIKLKMEQLASMHPDTHAFGATAESLRAQINELQAFATELRG